MAATVHEKILAYKKYLERSPEEDKILRIFRKLEKQNMTLDILQNTGIGKTVNSFRKHEGTIGDQARTLVRGWKQLLSAASPQQSSLQCETVSETSYNSHYVTPRLDGSASSGAEIGENVEVREKEVAMRGPRMDDQGSIHNVQRGKGPLTNVKHKQEGHKQTKHHNVCDDTADGKDKIKVMDKYADLSPDEGDAGLSSQSRKRKQESSNDTNPLDVKRHKEDIDSKAARPSVENTVEECNVVDEEQKGMSFEDFLSYDAASVSKKKKVNKEHEHSSRQHSRSGGAREQSKSKAHDKHSSSSSSSKHHSESNKSLSGSKKEHHTSDKTHAGSSRSHSGSSKSHSESKKSHSGSSKDHSQSSKGHSSSHKKHKHHGHHKSVGDKKEHKTDAVLPKSIDVPVPTKEVRLSQADIMSTLPETQPHYKPLPYLDLDYLASKRKDVESIDESQIGTKTYSKTAVYSGGKRTFLTAVPRLYDACLRVLADNIDALDYCGGIPYYILKPVLVKANPAQLYSIEGVNPQFIGETDELWEHHCKKDFRSCRPEEFESWRELYLRKHDERDNKLKHLTAKLSEKMEKAKPERTTKLAYVDTVAKAPRNIRRKQMKFGTAGPTGKQDPLIKLSSHGGTSGQPTAPRPRPSIHVPEANASSNRRAQKPVKVVAPMMQKTLKFMKKLNRR